jgi:hypothetical protein
VHPSAAPIPRFVMMGSGVRIPLAAPALRSYDVSKKLDPVSNALKNPHGGRVVARPGCPRPPPVLARGQGCEAGRASCAGDHRIAKHYFR